LRRFVDLHLRLPRETKTAERMARLATRIGLRLVGLTFDLQTPNEEKLTAAKQFEERGIETVSRIDLKPRNRNQLLMTLRKFRFRYDVVAVECSLRQLTAIAFRDQRVDLVFFSPGVSKSRLGELLPRRSERPVEVNVVDLLSDDLTAVSMPRLLRMSNLILAAQRKHLPLVISSGASDMLSMRSPRDMAAIASVFGLEDARALDAVSSIPLSIAEKNLEKHIPRYISEGVEMVRPKV